MLTNVGETQLHFTKSRGYCQVFRQRIFAFVVKVVKPLIQFPSFDLQIKHSAANHHVTCAIFGVCYCLLAAMTPLKSPGKQGQGRTLSSADTSHIRGQRHTICFIITIKMPPIVLTLPVYCIFQPFSSVSNVTINTNVPISFPGNLS